MAVTNTIIGTLVSDILNKFDGYDYLAVGTGTNPENEADTALQNEVYREINIDKIKDTNAGTYLWSLQLGLTEANGNTLSEIGLFDASTGGNMAIRKLLPTFDKTSDKEVWIDLQVKVEVTNL